MSQSDLIGRITSSPLWQRIRRRLRREDSTAWRGSASDISRYHEAMAGAGPEPALSDRVWSDLELDSVFTRADHCRSTIGQQLLYDMLRRPLLDPDEVARRDAVIRALAAQPELRKRIASAVRTLRNGPAYDLYRLTEEHLPERPAWAPILPGLTVSAIAALVIMFFDPRLGFFVLLGTIACNIAVQVFYRPGVHHLIRPIGALPGLLTAAGRLSRIDAPELRAYTGGLARLASAFLWTRGLSRHIRRENDADPISTMIVGYINLFFLADVNAFVISINLIRRHRAEIRELIRSIGTLDALCAVSRFREELPHWCTPELSTDARELHATGIYHPAVDDAVPNDLVIAGTSLLITGSNMAGKTTYLRAAGVCVVLAQTIATCPATAWRAPALRIGTLINRKDDLQGGRSYFLVEAEYVRDMLVSSAGTAPYIYIIDELYRGTNTRERVAAAHGVLRHLHEAGHMCIVATHDLELVSLLETWELRHFQESVNESGMHFDYLIRPGSTSGGNALRVLELTGYPVDVMATAYATFNDLMDAAPAPEPRRERE